MAVSSPPRLFAPMGAWLLSVHMTAAAYFTTARYGLCPLHIFIAKDAAELPSSNFQVAPYNSALNKQGYYFQYPGMVVVSNERQTTFLTNAWPGPAGTDAQHLFFWNMCAATNFSFHNSWLACSGYSTIPRFWLSDKGRRLGRR